jgi:phosphatidylinositol alpha-1,6-mannosyltransferase
MPNIPVENDVEGFGFVPVEAAVHGLPVIAANLEGIPDAIHDKKNGMLYPSEDAQACAALITYWHDHPEERKVFGQQAQAYTRTHFRWDDVAIRYAHVFDQLTART